MSSDTAGETDTSREAFEVTILGPFPPPLMGVSKNNVFLKEALQASGVLVRMINTSVGQLSHHRSFKYHLARLSVNLKAAGQLLNFRSRLYMVPDGGLGIIYSFFHIALASITSGKIFLHHRTFKYIDDGSRWMRLALCLAGSKATHVFLSDEMAEKFQKQYGPVAYLISGNAYFVPTSSGRRLNRTSSRVVIGHLSNLCVEKGFLLVAELIEALAEKNSEMMFKIAGPLVEESIAAKLQSLLVRFPNQVLYLGAIYGEAKQEFFDSIDVFVFPTLYRLEAQPNVLYEAMASGNLIIATDRGCIKEMVPSWAGLVVAEPENFVTETLSFLEAELEEGTISKRKASVQDYFERERLRARTQFQALLDAVGAA